MKSEAEVKDEKKQTADDQNEAGESDDEGEDVNAAAGAGGEGMQLVSCCFMEEYDI